MPNITLTDLYNKIEEIIKVSPAATDTTKLQGKRHKELLKLFAQAIFQQSQATNDLLYDWAIPSDRFNGYSNSNTDFLPGFYEFMHPSKGPNASLTAVNPLREIGSSTAVTLNYSFSAGSAVLSSAILNGITIPISPTSGTKLAATPTDTNTTFSLLVKDVNGLQNVVNTQVRYLSRFFFFTSNQRLASLSDTDLSAFIKAKNGFLTESRAQTAQVEPQGEYYYIAYAASLGQANGIKSNNFQDTSVGMKPFTYTNAQGAAQQFLLYSGDNLLTGLYNLEVY